MKILLTGKNGQLASEIIRRLPCTLEVLSVGSQDVDPYRGEIFIRTMRDYRPDVVINCWAYTDVDQAEVRFKEATYLNAILPQMIAIEAENQGSMLIHFSTDFIFDGNSNKPYTEDISPKPLNIYGQSKLKGEQNIQRFCKKYVVLRTSWLYSPNSKNFITSIISKARKNESIRVVSDQCGSPTTVKFLSGIVNSLLLRYGLDDIDFPYGIYHAACSGVVSRWELAKFINEYLNDNDIQGSPLILPISSNIIRGATRPRYSPLDSTKLMKTFGLGVPHWKTEVSHLIDEVIKKELI